MHSVTVGLGVKGPTRHSLGPAVGLLGGLTGGARRRAAPAPRGSVAPAL